MRIETTTLVNLIYKHAHLQKIQIPQMTRLVKLIYLIELEYFRLKHERLTNLDWKFYHYGPYPPALRSILGDVEIRESTWKDGKTSQQLIRDEAEFSLCSCAPFQLTPVQLYAEFHHREPSPHYHSFLAHHRKPLHRR
jgi:hypothetical protein